VGKGRLRRSGDVCLGRGNSSPVSNQRFSNSTTTKVIGRVASISPRATLVSRPPQLARGDDVLAGWTPRT
jgi:hypothetical protein